VTFVAGLELLPAERRGTDADQQLQRVELRRDVLGLGLGLLQAPAHVIHRGVALVEGLVDAQLRRQLRVVRMTFGLLALTTGS
jgi:hypothetical protein